MAYTYSVKCTFYSKIKFVWSVTIFTLVGDLYSVFIMKSYLLTTTSITQIHGKMIHELEPKVEIIKIEKVPKKVGS